MEYEYLSIILWVLAMICAATSLIVNIISFLDPKRKTIENIEKKIETVKDKIDLLKSEVRSLRNENFDLKLKVNDLELKEKLRDIDECSIEF